MSLGGGPGGGPGGGELQEVSQQIEQIEQGIEAVEVEIQAVRDEQADIDEAIDAIESLETGSTVQVPIGGGAYVRATIEDIDEVLVGIGADYATEAEHDDAIDLLEEQRDLLDGRIEELNEELAELETEEQQLNQHAQQLQQQQMQQQMGGLGGGGDGNSE
jgi:prefoldin alpha subunit